MKITSVEPQKLSKGRSASGRNERYNIYVDGVFTFGADEDLVVEHRLIVGKTINTPLLERLLFEAEVGKLMERMYSLWNVRPRSEKEVRDYLRKLSFKRNVKGQEEISEVSVDLLISKLKQKGLLNDEQFAKAWVEARRRNKRLGKIALKGELYQKGIDKEIVDQLMSEFVNREDEEKLAEQTLEKKIKSWKSLPYLEQKKKALEFLTRKGFEYSVAKKVIEKLVKKE